MVLPSQTVEFSLKDVRYSVTGVIFPGRYIKLPYGRFATIGNPAWKDGELIVRLVERPPFSTKAALTAECLTPAKLGV